MKKSRRERRDERKLRRSAPVTLNIVSLIDVFAILVFYLLVNALATEVVPLPKSVQLPASVAQAPARPLVSVVVGHEQLLVDQQVVMVTADLRRHGRAHLAPLTAALQQAIGSSTTPGEVNILADRRIPYHVLKQVMAACAATSNSRISLAVVEPASLAGAGT